MLQQLSFFALLVIFGHFATGQVLLPGRCPDVKLMTEFDLAAYTGIWYQYASYPFIYELGNKCVYAKYGDLGNNTVSVYNGAIIAKTGKSNDIRGYAKVLGPGVLAVVFFEGQSETEPNYRVLGTDYTTFAVVHSCSKLPLAHTEFLWVLTRDRIPSEETIAAAKKIIDDNRLSQSFLAITDQQDCPTVIDADITSFI